MEGTSFEEDWAAVVAAAPVLRRVLSRLHQAGSDRAGAVVRRARRSCRALAGRGQVGVLDQALTRGDVRASDAASPTGWVRSWGPSYRAGGAAALVKVAEAVAKPCNAPLAEAVLAARVPVGNAAVALTEMDKLLPRLTPACAETVLAGFVAIAQTDGPAQIRALRPRVIARYGRLGEFQRREDLLKHGRSLSQPYPDDGMAEYRLRLDPEGQAVLEAILGPAGRAATVDGDRVGPPHQRPTAGRRAGRGLPARRRRRRVRADHAEGRGGGDDGLPGPEGPDRGRNDADRGPAGSRDGPADGLRRRHHPRRPRDQGPSCWTWAGPSGLATPKLLLALCLRDRGCTFPGCSRPPGWCDAHHGVHWCDGGPTDLTNMALLCPRHHTIVHQKGYTATDHHDRGHLAPVAAPPRDPPAPGGSHRHAYVRTGHFAGPRALSRRLIGCGADA